jgi:thioredoxin 1
MTKVLYFSATWCTPCHVMAPIVEALQKELKDVEWEKIDVDKDTKLVEQFRVMSVPTFVIQNGERQRRLTGQVSQQKLKTLVSVWEVTP